MPSTSCSLLAQGLAISSQYRETAYPVFVGTIIISLGSVFFYTPAGMLLDNFLAHIYKLQL
jgi:ABC-type phosphate transport system permease subunit